MEEKILNQDNAKFAFTVFINRKNKPIVDDVFSFELTKFKNLLDQKINISVTFGVLSAILEKHKMKKYEHLPVGCFKTMAIIDERDFNTLLDLVFGSWEFQQLPSEKVQEALNPKSGFFNGIYKIAGNKDLSIIKLYSITKEKRILISDGISLIENKKNRRLVIALHRFSAAYKRSDPLDSVLDCCSCLEALYNLSDELRLKISLISFHLVSRNKKYVLNRIYEMYGKRNDFIHGNKIPDITFEKAKEYIEITAEILLSIIRNKKLPNSEELQKKIFDYY